ncbi:MAG: peptide deformylase [Cyanobacteria bacterium J06623_7]
MNYPAIAKIGNPVLQAPAQLVTNVLEPNLQKLIDSLIATAIAHRGVGIAAPQISLPYRLLVVASHPSERYPHAPKMAPKVMINPRLIAHGQTQVKDWEGCLSVPNTRGLVSRYQEITVEYATREGEVKQEILTGFIARIFQHELDHLNGILFIERIADKKDLYTEAEYQQIISSRTI